MFVNIEAHSEGCKYNSETILKGFFLFFSFKSFLSFFFGDGALVGYFLGFFVLIFLKPSGLFKAFPMLLQGPYTDYSTSNSRQIWCQTMYFSCIMHINRAE